MSPEIVINEAVEIAKKFGTEESPKFVNGILGSLIRSVKKLAWIDQAFSINMMKFKVSEIIEYVKSLFTKGLHIDKGQDWRRNF